MSFSISHKFKFSAFGLLGLASWYYLTKTKKLPRLMMKSRRDPLIRSRNCAPLTDKNVRIFSGTANTNLASEVASCLGTTLSKISTSHFADGECHIRIIESIRGKDVYIIQPTCPPVNEHWIELLLTISAMKRTSVNKITAVIPYYGYARGDRKMSGRIPISAADVAKMLEVVGVDHVICVEWHSGQIQGFFSPGVPVDNWEAQVLMVEYLIKSKWIKDYNKWIIVSPDAGGVYRAKEFAELLRKKTGANIGITMIVKQRMRPNEVNKMEWVGDVKGNDCIIIDDMIDTGGTLCLAAKVLKDNGANKVFAFATHGLFCGNALENITKSVLDKVVVTNSIPPKDAMKVNKIEYISIGILIAEAIRRIQNHESLSEVFLSNLW